MRQAVYACWPSWHTCVLSIWCSTQASLTKAGKLNILGSLEDNEPQDGEDDDVLSDEDSSKPVRLAGHARQNGSGSVHPSVLVDQLSAAVARTKLEDDD